MGPHLGSFWIPPLEMYQCVSRYHLEIIAVVKRWKSEKGEVRKALMPRREREEEWVESLKAGRKEVPSNDDGCGTYYKVSFRRINDSKWHADVSSSFRMIRWRFIRTQERV